MSNVRPCLVRTTDGDIKAVFHSFFVEASMVAQSGGQVSTMMALVEYADGTVEAVPPVCILFTDTTLKARLNPDTNKVRAIREALKENDGYCPCAIHKSSDTLCMCKDFKEQSTPGPCHCGLYVKEYVLDADAAKYGSKENEHGIVLQTVQNRCVCCGEIIPEGRQVCWRCSNGSD